MICAANVDKGCNVAQSVIQSCHQAACLEKTGEKRYPSINGKPLSTMIALVMKHFFSCQRYPCLKMEKSMSYRSFCIMCHYDQMILHFVVQIRDRLT